MPVRKVVGGYRWGSRGKVYATREAAERQARASYAHGYRPLLGRALLERKLGG